MQRKRDCMSTSSPSRRNGHTALRDASFSVPRGSIAALVGVNGSGKSTLFKALMGFVRVGHGEIAILGQPVNRALRQNPSPMSRSRKRWTGPSRCWWRMW